jgi:nucleoside-diphosphate-sugar epimerase
MAMKVFVSGASGCLGESIVQAFAQRGHSVVGHHRTKEKAAVVKAAGGESIVGDMDDAASWTAHAKGADILVHTAQRSMSGIRASTKVMDGVEAQELRWVKGLLDAGKGKAKCFIYTSSMFIYGNTDAPTKETAPINPTRGGQFKQKGEALAFEYAKQCGYESCIIVRPAMVYGRQGVFADAILAPNLAGKKAVFVGSGAQKLSLIAQKDVGKVYALAAEKSKGYEVFNAVDDDQGNTSCLTWMTNLASVTGGKKPSGVPYPMAWLVLGLFARDLGNSAQLDSSKAKRMLGFEPETKSYETGFAELAAEIKGGKPLFT